MENRLSQKQIQLLRALDNGPIKVDNAGSNITDLDKLCGMGMAELKTVGGLKTYIRKK